MNKVLIKTGKILNNKEQSFETNIIRYDFYFKILYLLVDQKDFEQRCEKIYIDDAIYELIGWEFAENGKIKASYKESILTTINYLKKAHIDICEFKNEKERNEHIIKLFGN